MTMNALVELARRGKLSGLNAILAPWTDGTILSNTGLLSEIGRYKQDLGRFPSLYELEQMSPANLAFRGNLSEHIKSLADTELVLAARDFVKNETLAAFIAQIREGLMEDDAPNEVEWIRIRNAIDIQYNGISRIQSAEYDPMDSNLRPFPCEGMNHFAPYMGDGRIAVVGGSPGMGKSWLLTNWARECCYDKPENVLFVSGEMDARAMGARFYSIHGKGGFTQRQLDGKEAIAINKYRVAKRDFHASAFGEILFTGPSLGCASVADVERMIIENGHTMIFLDAAYLLKPTNAVEGASRTNHDTIINVMYELADIAVRTGVPMVMSVQLGRDAIKKNVSLGDVTLNSISMSKALIDSPDFVFGVFQTDDDKEISAGGKKYMSMLNLKNRHYSGAEEWDSMCFNFNEMQVEHNFQAF